MQRSAKARDALRNLGTVTSRSGHLHAAVECPGGPQSGTGERCRSFPMRRASLAPSGTNTLRSPSQRTGSATRKPLPPSGGAPQVLRLFMKAPAIALWGKHLDEVASGCIFHPHGAAPIGTIANHSGLWRIAEERLQGRQPLRVIPGFKTEHRIGLIIRCEPGESLRAPDVAQGWETY